MARWLVLLMPLTIAAASPAFADEAYDRCMDGAKTNVAFRACGDAMVKRFEASLNKEWKMRFAGLDAKAKPALLEEQRLWIAWKDKSCLLWTSGAYGTMGQAVEFYPCRARVIEDRVNYIVGLSEYSPD